MSKIFLIAEIGINHNGDLSIAKKLIQESKNAGFDAVKFQKRSIEIVYSKKILDTPRESPWGSTTREQKYGLEFELSEYKEIDNFCKKIGIIWFASAWDIASLEFIEKFNLNYHKIASPMIIDIDFIKEVSKRKKYTFISTGMSSTKEIKTAVDIFRKNDCPFELMHCVSTYPMKPEHANLKTIIGLKEMFDCNVGYSGHESGLSISYAAASLGATSIERHITLDRSMYGSDQSASLSPEGFRSFVGGVRKIEIALGDSKVGHILDEEIPIAKKLRDHIKQN
tara:strand:- start:978 stop:1823 length:846 start_codon:yes stop_codon:yes gene_type:complete